MTRGSDKAKRALDKLIERYHSGNRLRIWSLVITVFGDAIVPRGGMVGMAALQELTDRMGIAPGALRAALSRLAKDGWVEREKQGRRSYYRLMRDSAETSARAARRIYAAGPPAWTGKWTLAIAPEEPAAQRDARAQGLADIGFVWLSNGLFVRPSAGKSAPPVPAGDMFVLDAGAASIPNWVLHACSSPDTDAAYGGLIAVVSPLDEALSAVTLAPLDAMVARTLLIHEWRRILLRDADLPAALRPPHWRGEEARAIVGSLYDRLLTQSETWLDTCDGRPDGALPAPDASLRRRFKAA